jgi:carbon starvation protein
MGIALFPLARLHLQATEKYMSTLVVCFSSLGLLLIAYVVYGRWLSVKLFELSEDAPVPSHELHDDYDFVPTKKSVIFGHHFTSIAGTGPIVGPAIAVFWGWLPAVTWVVLGAILIGGVHDMAALVISIRNRGQTLGEVAGRMISPRAKILFLTILALALWIVLAIFGLVIASIFSFYPESVLSVWIAMPIAICIGLWARRGHASMMLPSLAALATLYAAIYIGVYYLPFDLAALLPPATSETIFNANVVWTLLLLVYCFFASVLPVWLLLQPRDLINSHQLFLALGLLVVGLGVASSVGTADLFASTEAISTSVPADAPPILPFLFITIACGACSGFHCLVSSGTSSKQVACEKDAQCVGYGAMLLESALAVVVIMACTAGVGMGALSKVETTDATGTVAGFTYATDAEGEKLTGRAAWQEYYAAEGGWKGQGLDKKLAAFVEGGANFLTAIGIPVELGIGIVAVLVASFAATTLDTATRLQRYVLQELGASVGLPVMNKYAATSLAVGVAGLIAVFAGDAPGKGGLMLWPLFGATNQLLAGLALMVATFYLWRRSKAIAFLAVPMLLMLLMPFWAMSYDLLFNWIPQRNYLLVAFGIGILGLQMWIVVEGLLIWRKAKGVLEPQLPPINNPQPAKA